MLHDESDSYAVVLDPFFSAFTDMYAENPVDLDEASTPSEFRMNVSTMDAENPPLVGLQPSSSVLSTMTSAMLADSPTSSSRNDASKISFTVG